MQPKPRGRPCTPLDPTASKAARLGCDVQALRRERGLSQVALGELIGFSGQHVSDIERAKACVALSCIAAIDDALGAQGALLALQPAVSAERDAARQARAAARRGEAELLAALRSAVHLKAGDDDVEPTTRLGLLEAGASVALGVPVLGAVPARAGDVDPELPEHWAEMLPLLGRHAEMFGSRAALGIVQRELRVIAAHRAAACGELRLALMRVEARWAGFAAWLSHHADDVRGRDAWTDRALRLAYEAEYADMVAFVRARQSKFASDPRRAVAYAEDALRVLGASAQTRAWCARYAAVGHAKAGDTASCERRLHDAHALLEDTDSPPPPWAHPFRVTSSATRATEARCWLAMAPAKAVGLFEDALRDWPRAEVQHGGIQQARLALACAKAGELDRAKAEGAKAFAIYKQTRSATAARELGRLRTALAAA